MVAGSVRIVDANGKIPTSRAVLGAGLYSSIQGEYVAAMLLLWIERSDGNERL